MSWKPKPRRPAVRLVGVLPLPLGAGTLTHSPHFLAHTHVGSRLPAGGAQGTSQLLRAAGLRRSLPGPDAGRGRGRRRRFCDLAGGLRGLDSASRSSCGPGTSRRKPTGTRTAQGAEKNDKAVKGGIWGGAGSRRLPHAEYTPSYTRSGGGRKEHPWTLPVPEATQTPPRLGDSPWHQALESPLPDSSGAKMIQYFRC
nr:uncharacterized protein LOC119622101 isoform X4 [Chlorocebus sabaeus]